MAPRELRAPLQGGVPAARPQLQHPAPLPRSASACAGADAPPHLAPAAAGLAPASPRSGRRSGSPVLPAHGGRGRPTQSLGTALPPRAAQPTRVADGTSHWPVGHGCVSASAHLSAKHTDASRDLHLPPSQTGEPPLLRGRTWSFNLQRLLLNACPVNHDPDSGGGRLR